MFKYLWYGIMVAFFAFFMTFFFTSCSWYSIKMDRPDHTQFDNTDKRMETDAHLRDKHEHLK